MDLLIGVTNHLLLNKYDLIGVVHIWDVFL